MKWQIWESQSCTAQENMDADRELLKGLENAGQPVLHFYEWSGPCATYGHFINPSDHLDLKGAAMHRLQLGKRPTGGGIIFHLCDLAFSVLVPANHPQFSLNTLDNYAFVNQSVIKAVQKFMGGAKIPSLLQKEAGLERQDSRRHFCMAHPTKYDVIVDGRKVGGAAQRRTRHGFLHQGSIALCMPPEPFLRDVLKKDLVLDAMQQHTYALLGSEYSPKELAEAKRLLRGLLIEFFIR